MSMSEQKPSMVRWLRGEATSVWAAALGAMLSIANLPPASARVVQEEAQVDVRVADVEGRTVERKITVGIFYEESVPGRRPVLVLNHGRSPKAAERASVSVAQMAAAARWFTRLGFLVAVPIRVGYGTSGGPDVEYSGTCARKIYPPVYQAAAGQTLAVLEAMRARSDTAQDRAIVAGQSFGGTTAITIAALAPVGVQAAINFAGGGGGNLAEPQSPCRKDRLLQLFSDYGKTARMPTLWIYSANDQLWGPTLPRTWFDAFRAAGGNGEFAPFPPLGEDGHRLFSRAPQLWQPRVLEFLRPLGYTPLSMSSR
jgi:dienelactone hydrolase